MSVSIQKLAQYEQWQMIRNNTLKSIRMKSVESRQAEV